MTIAESILDVLNAASAPMTSAAIFETLEDAVDRQQVSGALHSLLKTGQVKRKETDEKAANGKTLFAYYPAVRNAPTPSSATPTADSRPPESAPGTSRPEGRGGRKTEGFSIRSAIVDTLEHLRAEEDRPKLPEPELELAVWNNGNVQLVHGNDSMLLPKGKVDQLKRFLERLYQVAEAEP